jgi:hypothetical protein
VPAFINHQDSRFLLKCACRMAFFKMCLADNLQDASDCGGLLMSTNCILADKDMSCQLSYVIFYSKYCEFKHIYLVFGGQPRKANLFIVIL